MKKLFLLLLVLPFLAACSSDDENEETQDYTSFVFVQTVNNILPNCIAAYLDNNNHYIKIANLGTISIDNPSKEITIENDNITEIYFFTDYNHTVRTDAIFKLQKNKKNTFKLLENVGGIGIEDKTDPTQYPQ